MHKPDMIFFYHPHTYETVPSAQLGLGLLLLATYARDLGANVKVINAQGDTMEKAKAKLQHCRYLCMYGCMVDAPIINELANFAKNNMDVDAVVVGGPVAKKPILMDYDAVSWLVDGPGEEFIYDLVVNSHMRMGIAGDMETVATAPLADINRYPYPDRSLIEGGIGGRIFHTMSEYSQKDDALTSTILTSRGCNRRCAFCESGIEECYVQEYDQERIEAEVLHCIEIGIRYLRISDDNIINHPKRLEWLCRLMHDNGVRWRGSIRVKPNDDEMYRMMAECGCEELSFGVESGDQHVLNVLRKGVKVGDSVRAVHGAKMGGIPIVRALMMMCTPGETRGTLKKNMEWVQDAMPDVVSLKVFVPYPGTAIYNEPEKFDCVIPDVRPLDYNNSAYRPDGSEPRSHIAIPGVLGSNELTAQFAVMKQWIDKIGAANYG